MNTRSKKPIRHVVLYAENDDVDLMLCERAFKPYEDVIELRMVSDGRSVIEWLDGHGSYGNRAFYPMPVMLILDSKLNDMTGLDVLRWVREQRRFRELPVVLHTGSTAPHDEDVCHQLGVVAVIEKDSTCHGLAECVRNLLLGEPVYR